jgi:hypothetical protein
MSNTHNQSNEEFIVKEDMICPITKQHCDDECCPVGAVCNLSGDDETMQDISTDNSVKEDWKDILDSLLEGFADINYSDKTTLKRGFVAGCKATYKRYISPLLEENEALKAWKQQAIDVMPDFQAIGKLLKVKLGESVSNNIIPGIKALIEENEVLKRRVRDLEVSNGNSGQSSLASHTASEGIIIINNSSAKVYSKCVNPNCKYCKGTGEIAFIANTVGKAYYHYCYGESYAPEWHRAENLEKSPKNPPPSTHKMVG